MQTNTLVFCALALATLTRAVGAMEMVEPALISAAAENAVRAQAGASAKLLTLQAAPLDARLRVAACDRPLTGFLTDASLLRAQTAVAVRCEGSVRWTIYTSVNVESQAAVLVAGRATPRSRRLTSSWSRAVYRE
jgi:flagella basal body P-ring formation protein FlgA